MNQGEPWNIRWRWLRDRLVVASGARTTVVPLSIGIGWAFIHPFVSTVSNSRLLWTALWLLWWFGWLGWFAGRLEPGTALVAGAIAVATFAAASRYWGFAIQPAELAFAVAGFAVAAIAGALRTRAAA
jgi:hypothetical protein